MGIGDSTEELHEGGEYNGSTKIKNKQKLNCTLYNAYINTLTAIYLD